MPLRSTGSAFTNLSPAIRFCQIKASNQDTRLVIPYVKSLSNESEPCLFIPSISSISLCASSRFQSSNSTIGAGAIDAQGCIAKQYTAGNPYEREQLPQEKGVVKQIAGEASYCNTCRFHKFDWK